MRSSLACFVVGAVAAIALLAPSAAEAGQSSNPLFSYCVKNADGSGYCSGSHAGVRASSDPHAYAFFGIGYLGAPYQVFGQYIDGQYYSCSAPSALAPLWSVAMIFRGTYYVAWNASGQCTSATVSNPSYIF